MTTAVPVPVPVPGGSGVLIDAVGTALRSAAPVVLLLWDGERETARHAPYDSTTPTATGFTADAELLVDGVVVRVHDAWAATDAGATCTRAVVVTGSPGPVQEARLGFGTALTLSAALGTSWADLEPFCPGVAYGNAAQVAPLAFAGAPARRSGVTAAVVREDRMAAPLMALRGGDGRWAAVLHTDPDGATIAADGAVEGGGEVIVDERMRFASIGAEDGPHGPELGVWFPGTERPTTYSSGGLPLLQLPASRPRFHPLVAGAVQRYTVEFRAGTSTGFPDALGSCWRWAWDRLRPSVAPERVRDIADAVTDVALDRVVTTAGRTGVALEANAAGPDTGAEDASAVMGFVGANTDLALVFLLAAEDSDEPDRARRLRAAAVAIMDTFTAIQMDPPAGEGFDTRSGATTTYRTSGGEPAVYARALAEGALAVLDADRHEELHRRQHPQWLPWVRTVADWFLRAQQVDGSFPRAWTAGSGAVLDPSPSGTATVVPFLVAVADVVPGAGPAAERAAAFVWERFGRDASYAGATLDNPDVVDKEAAVLAAEAFLAVADRTSEDAWVDRAASAATVAESWTYLWDVPMPVDADPARIHWKHGVPTTGLQLIASGVSMVDGFLSVNASVFARLWQRTGDPHWLDVARLVTHGPAAMCATPEHPHDLRGTGWQQEHWSFAPRRGYGLNRRWLTWVPVAHARGIQRLAALGADVADAVIELSAPQTPPGR